MRLHKNLQHEIADTSRTPDEQEHEAQHAQTSAAAAGGSDQQDSLVGSEDVNNNDDDDDGALPPDVVRRMTRKGWADATIIGVPS